MSDHLEEAKQNLRIHSVNLQSCQVMASDDCSALYIDDDAAVIQGFQGVSGVDEGSVDEEGCYLYQFKYNVAVRRVLREHSDVEETKDPHLVIQSVFSAFYLSDVVLKDEVLKAFSKKNVGYHVWPYWREFVQSTCARMSVPHIDIPFYHNAVK